MINAYSTNKIKMNNENQTNALIQINARKIISSSRTYFAEGV